MVLAVDRLAMLSPLPFKQVDPSRRPLDAAPVGPDAFFQTFSLSDRRPPHPDRTSVRRGGLPLHLECGDEAHLECGAEARRYPIEAIGIVCAPSHRFGSQRSGDITVDRILTESQIAD